MRVAGTIARSSLVANSMASSDSVRTVATWVAAGIFTTSGCGPVSQNVTSVRADVGGNSVTPISSRNLM